MHSRGKFHRLTCERNGNIASESFARVLLLFGGPVALLEVFLNLLIVERRPFGVVRRLGFAGEGTGGGVEKAVV